MLITRGLLVCCVLLVTPFSVVVGDPRDRNEAGDRSPVAFDNERAQNSRMGRSMMRSLQTAAQGDVQQAAVQALESAFDFWLPSLGDDAPEWAKRIEFEWDIQEDVEPEFSILTVQPLFQTEDQRQTVFTQLRGALNKQFGDRRMTTNAGLGYRFLMLDNSVLAGANAFYDYEWNYNHSRVSVGGELRWSGFDLYANNYWGLSGKHSANGVGFEEPLDGRDIELTAQIPYLPWARLRGSRYWWDTISAAQDIKGWSASVEADVVQNLQLEAGIKDDNFTEESYFVQLRFRLGAPNRPVLASSRFIDNRAFDLRDMRAHTLDKVRRENKIILERTATGVVITRGN